MAVPADLQGCPPRWPVMSMRVRALVVALAVLGCVGSACGDGSEQAMRVRGSVYAAALVSEDGVVVWASYMDGLIELHRAGSVRRLALDSLPLAMGASADGESLAVVVEQSGAASEALVFDSAGDLRWRAAAPDGVVVAVGVSDGGRRLAFSWLGSDARSSQLIVLDAGVLTVMPSPQPELAEQVLWMDERVVALSSSSAECPIAVVDPAGADPYCVVPDLALDPFGAWSGVTICGQELLLALPSPRDPTVVYSVSLAEAGLQAAAQKWTVNGLVEAGACDGRVVVGPFGAAGDTVVERMPAEQHSNSSAPSLSSAR